MAKAGKRPSTQSTPAVAPGAAQWHRLEGVTRCTFKFRQAPATPAKKARRQYRQAPVKEVVVELWPNGVPQGLGTPTLLQILAAELDRRGIAASPDVQRRALGRR